MSNEKLINSDNVIKSHRNSMPERHNGRFVIHRHTKKLEDEPTVNNDIIQKNISDFSSLDINEDKK